MSEYKKPLPNVEDSATAEFWKATKDHTLVVQRCDACGYLRWPPGPICPECLSDQFQWTPVEPVGTLTTYCVYERAFNPAFADDIPYAVGYVELDCGARMYGNLVGALDGFHVGSRVVAVFEAVTEEATLVRWQLPTDEHAAR